MAIDINALLEEGKCFGCLSALAKRRVYAAILCEIVQAGDAGFDCDTPGNGCVSCLSPEKLGFLQVQLLCLLNQIDDPSFDCDPGVILDIDPCIACLEASVLLTLITTMAANALLVENPAADIDPSTLLNSHPCIACLDSGALEVRITLLLAAWLEQFQAVDLDALVSQCDNCALNTPGAQSPQVGLLPLQAIHWEPLEASPPVTDTFFVARAGGGNGNWLLAGGGSGNVLLSGH